MAFYSSSFSLEMKNVLSDPHNIFCAKFIKENKPSLVDAESTLPISTNTNEANIEVLKHVEIEYLLGFLVGL